jgi:GT2 family glycosyltransferase
MDILAILVLYKCGVNDSKTLSSLNNNYRNDAKVFNNFKLIIYDNGSIDQEKLISVPFNFEYIFTNKNDGLAVAYNFAYNKAITESFKWLLLFDQDSSLPDDYLIRLNNELSNARDDISVAAVVSKMRFNSVLFSPSRVIFGGIHRPINISFTGIYDDNIFAIGSGSLLKISFLEQIGGFNEFFWMDCLDRWLYETISKHGLKVYVTNILIDHQLSVLNYDQFMSRERYSNIIKYETYFMKFYKSKGENLVYYLRLLKRVVVMLFSKTNRIYSFMTLKHLLAILSGRFQESSNRSG